MPKSTEPCLFMQNEDPDHNNFRKKMAISRFTPPEQFQTEAGEGQLLLLLNSSEFNESDHFYPQMMALVCGLGSFL